ncbi:MAG: SGNH/GDSL hydrolase family protein [Clostridiaceae bacterium]|nr:SGNH/GDSL hydrolase family protein [Clostridiaceae bacterium]
MNIQAARIFQKVILPEKTIHIKLLGDSITHGVGGSGFVQDGEPITQGFARNPHGYCWAKLFADYMESWYPCEVRNNACTGTAIEFILDRFDELVSPQDDIVLCVIGTNNRHQYYANAPMHTREQHMQAFYEHILALSDRFRAAGKDVVFVANIPASADNEKSCAEYARLFHMSDVSDIYLKASLQRGFPLVNLYSAFLRDCEQRGITVDSLLADGLHPSDRGHETIFRLLMDEIGLSRSVEGLVPPSQA